MTHKPFHSVTPEEDLNAALKLITKNDVNQLLVLRDGKCAGLLSRADILGHLQLSQELGLESK
jgi:CBS domain-containing protein